MNKMFWVGETPVKVDVQEKSAGAVILAAASVSDGRTFIAKNNSGEWVILDSKDADNSGYSEIQDVPNFIYG